MASYTFGIAVSAGTDWLMQSVSFNRTSQEALALDNDGEPKVAHYYQKVNEATFEAIVPTTATLPEVGSTFTYNSEGYYITGVTETQSNTDYVKYSITAKRFITAQLPAASTTTT